MILTTSVYAAVLTSLYIGLSINVVRVRRHHAVALGDGDIDAMLTKIRAHANCAEYAPLFIVLLALAEYQGMRPMVVNGLGLTFLAGRLSHAYGIIVAEPRYRWFAPRVTGMVLTFTCMGVLACILISQHLL
jgi:uncharacterized membrane protein YecN with MAPEG domain